MEETLVAKAKVIVDYASIMHKLVDASETLIAADNGAIKQARTPSGLLTFYKTIQLQGATGTGMSEAVFGVATQRSLIFVSGQTKRKELVAKWGIAGFDVEHLAQRIIALDEVPPAWLRHQLADVDYVFVLNSDYFWSRYWLSSQLAELAPAIRALLLVRD